MTGSESYNKVGQRQQARVVGAVRSLVSVAVVAIVVGELLLNVPGHPLMLRPVISSPLLMISPEAWAFFTKDPREPQLYTLVRSGEKWMDPISPGFTAGNWLGMGKRSRIINGELEMLRQLTPKSAWIECEESALQCLRQQPHPTTTIESQAERPHVCGEVVFDLRPIAPWAWARSATPVIMPGETALLSVACRNHVEGGMKAAEQ